MIRRLIGLALAGAGLVAVDQVRGETSRPVDRRLVGRPSGRGDELGVVDDAHTSKALGQGLPPGRTADVLRELGEIVSVWQSARDGLEKGAAALGIE